MNEWEWKLLEETAPLASVRVGTRDAAPGDRVRLRPRSAGDTLDLFLTGQVAIIEAIEQDYDGRVHVAVVLEDDPGRDLGFARQTGHRFFFTPEELDEVEGSTPARSASRPSVLIAGIGNIFFGDDGFGVEVVRRLQDVSFPLPVKLVDFGIRGFDLACALVDGYDVAILVDACPRGALPGTVHLLEPDLASEDTDLAGPPTAGPHGLDPVNVIRLARSLGSLPRRVLIVGCEPASLGGDDGQMGLSPQVDAGVREAAVLVTRLVTELSAVEREQQGGTADR
jgi:hydrogenase maturation protease